MIYMAPIS